MSREEFRRVLERESQQASRLLPGEAGRVELSGATDEGGILVELTSFDVERMGGAEVEKYQERRRRQIADKEAKAEEERRYKLFEDAFTAEGGSRSDAKTAYRAMRNDAAARAARLADEEARQLHQRTTKAAI
jgi:hypothetical protein